METLAFRFIPITGEPLVYDDATRMSSPLTEAMQDTRSKTIEAAHPVLKLPMSLPGRPERAAIYKSLNTLKKSLDETSKDSLDFEDAQTKLNDTWNDFLDSQPEFDQLQETLCLDYSNKEALTAYQKSFAAYRESFKLYTDACEGYEDSFHDYDFDITQIAANLNKYIAADNVYTKNFAANPKDVGLIALYRVKAEKAFVEFQSPSAEYDDVITTYASDEKNYLSDKKDFETHSKNAEQIQGPAPLKAPPRISIPTSSPLHRIKQPHPPFPPLASAALEKLGVTLTD